MGAGEEHAVILTVFRPLTGENRRIHVATVQCSFDGYWRKSDEAVLAAADAGLAGGVGAGRAGRAVRADPRTREWHPGTLQAAPAGTRAGARGRCGRAALRIGRPLHLARRTAPRTRAHPPSRHPRAGNPRPVADARRDRGGAAPRPDSVCTPRTCRPRSASRRSSPGPANACVRRWRSSSGPWPAAPRSSPRRRCSIWSSPRCSPGRADRGILHASPSSPPTVIGSCSVPSPVDSSPRPRRADRARETRVAEASHGARCALEPRARSTRAGS